MRNKKLELIQQIEQNNIKLSEFGLNSNKSLHSRLKELVTNMRDEDYRIRFASMLSKITESCIFNSDGSVEINILGSKVKASAIYGSVTITYPNGIRTPTFN